MPNDFQNAVTSIFMWGIATVVLIVLLIILSIL